MVVVHGYSGGATTQIRRSDSAPSLFCDPNPGTPTSMHQPSHANIPNPVGVLLYPPRARTSEPKEQAGRRGDDQFETHTCRSYPRSLLWGLACDAYTSLPSRRLLTVTGLAQYCRHGYWGTLLEVNELEFCYIYALKSSFSCPSSLWEGHHIPTIEAKSQSQPQVH